MTLPATIEKELTEAFQEGTPMQRLFGAAWEELGGLDFFLEWAEENKTEFIRLFMAVNPPPIQHNNTPAGGPAININLHPGLAPGPLDSAAIPGECENVSD